MGVFIHYLLSPYSVVMGILWFTAFVLLGLLMQKLKFPIVYSIVPLLLLLVLSILRMFVAVELPSAEIIESETLYPAIVSVVRFEIVPFQVIGFPISIANVFIVLWVAGAIFLTARYIRKHIELFPLTKWYEEFPRDEHAESLLEEIIGYNKNFRIFRSKAHSMAVATAFKPYIILPMIDFPDSELRVILAHEWKHIRDKDYISAIIVNLISFVFWWNPVVYALKKNFLFAIELKNDQYAVSNEDDYIGYLKGIKKLNNFDKRNMGHGVNSFINADDGLEDRILVMAMRDEMRDKSRHRRIITSTVYSVVIVTLFLASYTFTVLPATWESPYYDSVYVGDFMEVCREEIGDVLRTDEIFLVDNSDGTFSYYVGGNFMMYVETDSDLLNWVEIRAREDK